MYVLANQPDAEDFVRDRFLPTMKTCLPVADKLLRQTKLGFTFSTMPLYFVGAGSLAKLQGKPIKKLWLDEVRNYKKGAFDTVMKRVRSFGDLAQVFIISTPGLKGDSVDLEYLKGDQRVWHFPCPGCGKQWSLHNPENPHRLPNQLKWDTNETTKPGGHYNFDKLSETIRWQCDVCGHVMRDTPTERKAICRTGKFIAMNPSAPRNHVSFTWNALLPWWVKWRSVVEEFLHARAAARLGNKEPMKTFVNETLGESWTDELGVIEDWGSLTPRMQDYGFGEAWPEETTRFMAADRQESGGEHYFWVIRSFSSTGSKSRLVAYGRAATLMELETIRRQHNVGLEHCCIDSGWKAGEIYRFCLSSGWKPFKGEPEAEYFLVQVKTGPKSTKTIRRIYQKTFVDPYLGQQGQGRKTLRLYRHVGNATKDLLAEFMQGLVGEWSIPRITARDYLRQVTAERREEVKTTTGQVKRIWRRATKDNHYFDCELIILVAAVITRTVSYGDPEDKGE